jgi:hypothetical protein
MKVPNLLELVRAELQKPGVNPIEVSRETNVGYDSILRIRRGAAHDPGWSHVHALANHLLTKRKRAS